MLFLFHLDCNYLFMLDCHSYEVVIITMYPDGVHYTISVTQLDGEGQRSVKFLAG